MIIRHITAGRAARAARAAVSGALHAIYQDAGYEDVFNSGNLDAVEMVLAGGCVSKELTDTRNLIRLQLIEREGAAS